MLFMSRIEDINQAVPVPYNSDVDIFSQVVNQIHKVDTEKTHSSLYQKTLKSQKQWRSESLEKMVPEKQRF